MSYENGQNEEARKTIMPYYAILHFQFGIFLLLFWYLAILVLYGLSYSDLRSRVCIRMFALLSL